MLHILDVSQEVFGCFWLLVNDMIGFSPAWPCDVFEVKIYLFKNSWEFAGGFSEEYNIWDLLCCFWIFRWVEKDGSKHIFSHDIRNMRSIEDHILLTCCHLSVEIKVSLKCLEWHSLLHKQKAHKYSQQKYY